MRTPADALPHWSRCTLREFPDELPAASGYSPGVNLREVS